MRFSYWPGASSDWPELLSRCRHAEASGWEGLWFADHFMPNADDLTAPVHESFTVLAALAAAVPRVRIGHMVAANTYRHPALTAKMAPASIASAAGASCSGWAPAGKRTSTARTGSPSIRRPSGWRGSTRPARS